ncbi:hypothetical protein FHG64_09890 [Antarcticibacterium flavum]|uniref:Uncharacterized protein n=1 Tax=Antarcticibacterium flavum TaxID=2058175 RepID=A0A5B7X2B1_9FLAO|nr:MULTISPECIES: hypothetical protein [Antarcticibacterium]MCM4160131.1 hypothetical protein [Antarcticibacterium sp. W02-3]QCY69684.1 hypothetical protein FHG64_09890 [Antarcticibacterium flavum]
MMNRFNLYIAYFLLTGFLFPQAANAMHYLLIPHSSQDSTGESYELASPPYDYHTCDYQFNSLKYFLNFDQPFDIPAVPLNKEEEKYFYSISFINELAFHYSLRGPPLFSD